MNACTAQDRTDAGDIHGPVADATPLQVRHPVRKTRVLALCRGQKNSVKH
ncbi:MAG: hypothetical protein WBN51_02555 [Gammaproteobacteria bacterium]